MSNGSVRFQVQQVRLPEITKNFCYEDLTELLLLEESKMLLYADYPFNDEGKGVYFNENDIFNLNIIEGRNFVKEDFLNYTNTMVVAEEYLKYCIKENQKYYYIFDGYEYEVIGVYKKEMYDANYYINIFSKNMLNNIMSGIFYIDIPEQEQNIEYFIDELIKNNKGYNNGFQLSIDTNYNKNNVRYFIKYLYDTWLITLICLLPCLLILINISAIFNLWLKSRTNEMQAKYIIGCTKEVLNNQILIDNLILSLIGYLLAIMIIKFMDLFNIMKFSTYSLNLKLILYVFAIYILVILCLTYKFKKIDIKKYLDKVGGE